MRLVMTLLVRDEADIVRENLDFHFSQGVDFAIVMDNRSRDGTTEILREYEAQGRARIVEQPGVYHQVPWMTEMARMAVCEDGADWVLPNDADEFWMPRARTLRGLLEQVPQDVGAVVCRRVPFDPTPEDGRPWWERMTLRQRIPMSKTGLPLNSKLIHRAHPNLTMTKGNHQRGGTPIGATLGLPSVEVLHFQMRTYKQFERGVIVRGSTLKGAEAPKQQFNLSRRREYRIWREGGLEAYYRQFVKEGPDDEAAEDTRLRDHLRELSGGAADHRPARHRHDPRAALPGARARAGAIPVRLGSAVSRLRAGPPADPAPFVVGVPGSGTTLLCLMLDAHPQLAIPAETHFIPKLIKRWRKLEGAGAPDRERVQACLELIISHRRWSDLEVDPDELAAHLEALRDPGLADVARAVHLVHARGRGKPRWGDKSPSYLATTRPIARILPEARFVHVIRDGRDVALSLAGESPGAHDVADAARRWKRHIPFARRQASLLPPHTYTEVRYEALVSDPEPALRRIVRFLGLPWDEAMLAYHEGATARMAPQPALLVQPPRSERAGRWRTKMAPEDSERFEEIAGNLLRELGYPIGGDRT